MPLIECVPNVSEGRRADVIAAIGDAIAAPGIHMLDRSSDPSHNRSVYTFAGEPAALRDAVLRLFAAAVDAHRPARARRRPPAHRRRRRRAVRPAATVRRWTSASTLAQEHRGARRGAASRAGVPVRGSGGDGRAAKPGEHPPRRRGRRRAPHEASRMASRFRTRSAASDRRRHRHRRAPHSHRLQRQPRVQPPRRRQAHRVGHSREQRRPAQRQGAGHAARPRHRPGVDEPDQLQRDIDDDGVRHDHARSRRGRRARAGERDCRARCRRTRCLQIRCAQTEVARGRPGPRPGNSPGKENEDRKTNIRKSPRRAALFAFRYSVFVTASSTSASVLLGTMPNALIFL